MTNKLATLLLTWYQKQGRNLPWRVKGGAHPNPYVILVSEFMLQQTGVKTVLPYFHRFMQRFPTIQDLAIASQEDVYQYWQGLGYYTRARSLHTTAQMIVNEFGGQFPQKRQEILKLKGIGNYTASSFLALAFNLPETVIDGNVTRIICRMYHLTQPANEISDIIRQKAESLTDSKHPADYASAIMDLGATICTPKKPQCLLCPWQQHCLSKNAPDLEQIPHLNHLEKKRQTGFVYLIYNTYGKIFIRKRTEKGLLSGLYEFPWTIGEKLFSEFNPQDSGLNVSHIFTHINLNLRIFFIKTDTISLDGQFISPTQLNEYPLSTLMKKIYKKAETAKK